MKTITTNYLLLNIDSITAIERIPGDDCYTVTFSDRHEMHFDLDAGPRLIKAVQLAARPLPVRLFVKAVEKLSKGFHHVFGRKIGVA